MTNLKISLVISLLLCMENIYNVQAGPADKCLKSINNILGKEKSAFSYLLRILDLPNKASINFNSNEDYVLYFNHLRENVDLKTMRNVEEFCDLDPENIPPADCIKELRRWKVNVDHSKTAIFKLFFENYDQNTFPDGSNMIHFYNNIYLSVEVTDDALTASQWCDNKYQKQ